MDITLERILSLIPKKPDGKYVHGAKTAFARSIDLHVESIIQWERGKNDGYNAKLYEIAEKYNVSVEWLKGETDDPARKTTTIRNGVFIPAENFRIKKYESDLTEDELINEYLQSLSRDEVLDLIAKATDRLRNLN